MRLATFVVGFGLLAGVVVACGSDGDSTFGDGSQGNDANGDGGTGGTLGGGAQVGNGTSTDSGDGTIKVLIRDFKKYDGTADTNPDFENTTKDGTGLESSDKWCEKPNCSSSKLDIVKDRLSAAPDRSPVYNTAASFKGTAGRTQTTHGEAHFQEWYHDSPHSKRIEQTFALVSKDGINFVYDSRDNGIAKSKNDATKQFFPIDDDKSVTPPTIFGFGNQGQGEFDHNYHFTVELRTVFTYAGKETFTFTGDDDVFVYIADQLVINLGGIHGREPRTVDLDKNAAALGLKIGTEYPLELFMAERHYTESNLRIETTLKLKGTRTK